VVTLPVDSFTAAGTASVDDPAVAPPPPYSANPVGHAACSVPAGEASASSRAL